MRLRMDSAGYQHDVLKFCATGDGGKRDVIEFTVSNDMTAEFRSAAMEAAEEDWRSLYRNERGKQVASGQEWAEVVHAAMRLLALPGGLKKKRLKAICFALIDTPARVVDHSRQLFVRLARGHPAARWLPDMRRTIRRLALSTA